MQSINLIVILGPTTSSKTSLAVNLAHTHSGKSISADSRQVFRGMDLGTGLYLDAALRGDRMVEAPENHAMRRELAALDILEQCTQNG